MDYYLYIPTLFSLLIFIILPASIETIDVVVYDVITVQSKGFPNACCEAVNYTFVLEDGSTYLLPLHVTFTDLDIPLGTVLLFTDSNNTLFEEQIRISLTKPYVYERKTLIFHRVPVYLSVIPAHDNPTTYYAGYRFQIYSYLKGQKTGNKYYWNTDERCPATRPPMEGGTIVMKWDKTLSERNVTSLPVVPMHDCMWVLKVPPEFEHSTYKTLPQVFIRFSNLTIDEVLLADFSLEVVYAPYSTGSPRTIIDKSNYKEEKNNFFHHDTVMYMRLRLPYIASSGDDLNKYHIEFVYGLMAKNSDDGNCSLGFLPSFSCFKSGVCISMANKCDGIEHCPNFEDELPETCAKSSTTTQSSTSVPSTTTQLNVCPGTSVLCLWPSRHCVEAADYVKKCQPHAKCGSGYTLRGLYCYKIVTDITSWTNARQKCQADGADLASIDSQAENDYLATIIPMTKCFARAWTGLNAVEKHGNWRWVSTGNTPGYVNWSPGEPNHTNKDELCVEIGAGMFWMWNDNSCSASYIHCAVCKTGLSTDGAGYDVKATTQATPSSSLKPDRTCPSVASVLCDNGVCVPYSFYCSSCTATPVPFMRHCPGNVCVTYYHECPGEVFSCPYMTRKCPDGTCSTVLDVCPRPVPETSDKEDAILCNSYSKRCSDGKCISTYRRCPEDNCPSYQPHKCGDTCYYESDRCDGYCSCSMSNCEDEKNCHDSSNDESSVSRFLLILLCLPIAILGIIFCCSKLKQHSTSTGAAIPMQPMNSVPAANTSAYQHTSQTYYVPLSVPSPHTHSDQVDGPARSTARGQQPSGSQQTRGAYGHGGSSQFDPPPYDIAVTSSARPTSRPLNPTTSDVEVSPPPPSYESLRTLSAPYSGAAEPLHTQLQTDH